MNTSIFVICLLVGVVVGMVSAAFGWRVWLISSLSAAVVVPGIVWVLLS